MALNPDQGLPFLLILFLVAGRLGFWEF
uniref:Uncharacterized protein LOC101306919 n=1 Tax=Rhizophora mucronata TaxID=61149 RepID=A0A2P2JZ41_RHIMU